MSDIQLTEQERELLALKQEIDKAEMVWRPHHEQEERTRLYLTHLKRKRNELLGASPPWQTGWGAPPPPRPTADKS